MKNKKINYILIAILTILVLYFSLKDNFNGVINEIASMNILYLILAFLMLFIFIFLRSYPMYKFSKKINKGFKYTNALILMFRTQFFNAVTPFATGGQPYQIYYLNKCGIDYAASTSLVLENFIVYQIALVALGIISLISNKIFNIFDKVNIIKELIAIGFIINTLIIVVMFIVAFSKKLNKKIISFGINLLTKLRLVKNREKTLKKWDNNINRFHKSAQVLLENKKDFILNIFYNFLALMSLYSIPMFILFAMGDFNSLNIIVTIITSAYIMIIGSFVPIPGGTGGLEYGFITFYGNFILGSKLSALMLVWRFITYYFGMILGAISLNVRKVKTCE